MDEKIKSICDAIDELIDIAHETYFECESEKERAMLDGKIKAYWEVYRFIANVFETEDKDILNAIMDCEND